VVTICTTSCDIQQFCVLPKQCIYVFRVDLSTYDYFPTQHYVIFITETESVCCAVRTEFTCNVY